MLFLAIVIIGAFLLYPFISAILLAAITAYVFRPLVRRLESHTRSYHLALAIIFLMVAVPFMIFAAYLAGNVTAVIAKASETGTSAGLVISAVLEKIAATPLGYYFSDYILNPGQITDLLAKYAVSLTSGILHDMPFIFLDIVIYFAATYYFLRDGHMILEFARQYARTLPNEEALMITSIVKGIKRSFDVLFVSYVSMSIITSALAFAGFFLLGVPNAGFLALLSGLFSFLPIFGVWMVYVPAGVYLYSIGSTTSAILVILYGLLVLTFTTDFIIRPILGARQGMVSPLTLLLGFFSGPLVFGAKGVILGPVLLVVVQTVIREYAEFRICEEKTHGNRASGKRNICIAG